MQSSKYVLALCLAGLTLFAQTATEDERLQKARTAMVQTQIAGRGIQDQKLLEVMGQIPRHKFVPADNADQAYQDRPLPIGYGQTISQPYMVAAMTEQLQLKPGQKVLEIGSGSGYQTAVLASLGAKVYSIEIIEPLLDQAREKMQQLGFKQVHFRSGDGYFGWQEEGPFDAIIVTAAASHVPPPLLAQLKPGGRMIIPIGSVFSVQNLMLLEKKEDGRIVRRSLMPVRFVPLTGKHAP